MDGIGHGRVFVLLRTLGRFAISRTKRSSWGFMARFSERNVGGETEFPRNVVPERRQSFFGRPYENEVFLGFEFFRKRLFQSRILRREAYFRNIRNRNVKDLPSFRIGFARDTVGFFQNPFELVVPKKFGDSSRHPFHEQGGILKGSRFAHEVCVPDFGREDSGRIRGRIFPNGRNRRFGEYLDLRAKGGWGGHRQCLGERYRRNEISCHL